MTKCTLQISGRLVIASEGPMEAEYALFDPEEIDLRATEPGRIYEFGYSTDVSQARFRLEAIGITPELARQCAGAMHASVAVAYAKGAARSVAKQLSAKELFEAATFDHENRRYLGTFVDTEALAHDLELPNARLMLQALYLALLLEEAGPDDPVQLSTIEYTRSRRAGERTHRRVRFEGAGGLPDRIRELGTRELPKHTGLTRTALTQILQARAEAARDVEECDRFGALLRTAETREAPTKGPLASPELWMLEMDLRDEKAGDVDRRIDAFERALGRTPGSTYLRLRCALHASTPETILPLAEKISALALSMTDFSEVWLLAANAWIKANEPKRALPFAKDLVNALNIDEEIRERAEAIVAEWQGVLQGPSVPPLRSSMPTRQAMSSQPPERVSLPPASQVPTRDLSHFAEEARRFASGEHMEDRAPLRDSRSERPERILEGGAASSFPPPSGGAIKGASRPPYQVESGPVIFPPSPIVGRMGELVANLSLPAGVSARPVSPDERPTTALEARILFTLLARELADQYNRELGIVLRTNLEGVEAIQSVLFERYPDHSLRGVEDLHDALRHGAFLSEVIARTLDGVWDNIESSDVGDWSMLVPPNLRVWPFGRVLRLIAKGHKERDLVSYYLELTTLRSRA